MKYCHESLMEERGDNGQKGIVLTVGQWGNSWTQQARERTNKKRGGEETQQPATRLEFVHVLVIVSVVVIMVIMVTCILNRYKLSSASFIGRHAQRRRRQHTCSVRKEELMCPTQHQHQQQRDRPPCIRTPSRDPFRRPPHRPLYPYSQEEIDLPPSISLSDGEEPPPYQGPCTMQLRPPEQQQEINRESVRAPPNRTVYDSDYLLATGPAGPCPPSSHAGVSATLRQVQGRLDGPPPPSYSEVFGTRRPVSCHGDPTVVHSSGSMPPELGRFCYKAV
uniref:protein TMEPAI isoform X3 n=1 Tax=Myxine glutinosa TaxID=7769 RepID=UPI00358EF411